MTVAIPEAATVARSASSARSARVIPPQRPRRVPASGTSRPLPGPPPFSQPRTRNTQRSGRKSRGGDFYREARRRAPTTRVHRGNYQAVILAEFVAAIVLVALSPVASKKQPDGLSPYAGQDMIKLGAITGVYFALALVSVGGPGAGRFAAWFGGLILLAVGLSEAAHLASIIDLGGQPSTGKD